MLFGQHSPNICLVASLGFQYFILLDLFCLKKKQLPSCAFEKICFGVSRTVQTYFKSALEINELSHLFFCKKNLFSLRQVYGPI